MFRGDGRKTPNCIFDIRLSKLALELKNGINSAQENSLELAGHLHIEVADYQLWKSNGSNLNELVVKLTKFVDSEFQFNKVSGRWSVSRKGNMITGYNSLRFKAIH